MLSSRQVGRKLSSKLRQTTAQLYSSSSDLDNTLLEEVEQTSQQIKSYPIYYVDTPGTVADIASTIDYFYENKAKGKKFVIILDHTLLVEGQNREIANRRIIGPALNNKLDTGFIVRNFGLADNLL